MELKILKLQNCGDKCVVCGQESFFSLGAKFYECQKDIVCSIVKGRDEHQSYPNRMHGGLITALLDETIGRAILINEPDMWGVTTTITVKFRKPVPLNENLKCFGILTKNTSLGFSGKGIIESENGELLATAEATYVKMKLNQITTKNTVWTYVPDERSLKFVKLNNEQALGVLN
jgi:acyl-coenzyme A thioesterase PaaI-like protein